MLLSPSPTDNRDVYSCSGRAVTRVLCFCCGCVGGWDFAHAAADWTEQQSENKFGATRFQTWSR